MIWGEGGVKNNRFSNTCYSSVQNVLFSYVKLTLFMLFFMGVKFGVLHQEIKRQ